MFQHLARRAGGAALARRGHACLASPCASNGPVLWFLQSSSWFSSDTTTNNNANNKEKGKKGRGGRSFKGTGRNRGGAAGGAAGEDRNVEWRQWIEKRLAELEEKGVLKKSELEKPAATSPTPSRSGITRSPLNRAILKELKKLPAPDPETGFSEIGKRREEEEEEILEVLEAALSDLKDNGKESKSAGAGSGVASGKSKEGGVGLQELASAVASASAEKTTSPQPGGSELEMLDRLEDDPTGKVQAGRINPNRLFFPGQKYELEELDPYTAPPEVAFPTRRRREEEEITDNDDLLLRNLHFMNYDFLSRYVTEQGKILPRRKTGLKKKVQRRLVRTIKTARQMAILPINSREREEF